MTLPRLNKGKPSKGKRIAPAPPIEKRGKKVSKKSAGKGKSRVTQTLPGGEDEQTDCDCEGFFAGMQAGIVYWDGDNLQVLEFPNVESTLQYVGGVPVWVNNN